MSEKIKEIIYDIKDSLNETPKNMYKYNKITLNLNEFEEILNYIEQLEKIRKEAIEFIEWHYKDNKEFFKNKGIGLNYPECDALLKILSKGDNNGK